MEVLPYNKILTKLKRRRRSEALDCYERIESIDNKIDKREYFYVWWLWGFFKDLMVQNEPQRLTLQEFYKEFIKLDSVFLGRSWRIKNLIIQFIPYYDKHNIEILVNNPRICPQRITPLTFFLDKEMINILSIYIKNYDQITKALYECADKTILNCAKLVKLRKLEELKQEARNE